MGFISHFKSCLYSMTMQVAIVGKEESVFIILPYKANSLKFYHICIGYFRIGKYCKLRVIVSVVVEDGGGGALHSAV